MPEMFFCKVAGENYTSLDSGPPTLVTTRLFGGANERAVKRATSFALLFPRQARMYDGAGPLMREAHADRCVSGRLHRSHSRASMERELNCPLRFALGSFRVAVSTPTSCDFVPAGADLTSADVSPSLRMSRIAAALLGILFRNRKSSTAPSSS
jgi:hypothetical protein